MYQWFVGGPRSLSWEPGWGSRGRGSWRPRGCASRGWTRRGLDHGRGCTGGRRGAGRRGAGPSGWWFCAGDRIGDQRLLFGGRRRMRRGRRRGRVMCARRRRRRSPVVRLLIFDPLEANTAALWDTRGERHSHTSSFQWRLKRCVRLCAEINERLRSTTLVLCESVPRSADRGACVWGLDRTHRAASVHTCTTIAKTHIRWSLPQFPPPSPRRLWGFLMQNRKWFMSLMCSTCWNVKGADFNIATIVNRGPSRHLT